MYSFQGHYLKETALDQLHACALCSLYKMTTLERLAEILIVEVDNHALQDEDKSVLCAPSVNHHNSRENVKYIMKLSGTYNESLEEGQNILLLRAILDKQEEGDGRYWRREDDIQ